MNRSLSNILLSAVLATSAYVVAAPMMKTEGSGEVKSIDAKAASITLAQEAIPALKWPAATMTLHLAKPELASGIRIGQKVKYDLEMGQDHQMSITAISVLK